MSKLLADLLGEPKEKVAAWLDVLEAKTGRQSHDIRLTADVQNKVYEKIASLGLDPQDTTAEELYHALLSKYQKDSDLINRSLSIVGNSSFSVRQNAAIHLLYQLVQVGFVWAVRPIQLKKLLLAQPPRKLMKQWNYRSVTSLAKREDPTEAFLAACQLESAAWQKTFRTKLSGLDNSAYNLEPVRLLALDPARYKDKDLLTVSDKTVGAAAIYPSQKTQALPVLSLTLLLAKEMEKICVEHQVRALSHINPALAWWADTEHLFMHADEALVSLNIHDLALAHSAKLAFSQRTYSHCAEAFMKRLASAYRQRTQDLPVELASFENAAAESVAGLTGPVRELAYEEVEA